MGSQVVERFSSLGIDIVDWEDQVLFTGEVDVSKGVWNQASRTLSFPMASKIGAIAISLITHITLTLLFKSINLHHLSQPKTLVCLSVYLCLFVNPKIWEEREHCKQLTLP